VGSGPIVPFVRLDVYRSCTRQEKREVLDTFWRTRHRPSNRIHEAALQYGPFAIASLAIVVAELAFVILVSINRAPVVGWFAAAFEAVVLLSLWWSLVRLSALKGQTI
jgi:hypothetical protein